MVDFEMAAIKSVQSHFENAEIHGCFFHFSQSIWRHVQQLGLAKIYSENGDFAVEVRMLLSLAFVPVDSVVEAYQELAETEFFSENTDLEWKEQIQNLMAYFQSTYVFRFNSVGKQQKPLFPVELWNMYAITLAG